MKKVIVIAFGLAAAAWPQSLTTITDMIRDGAGVGINGSCTYTAATGRFLGAANDQIVGEPVTIKFTSGVFTGQIEPTDTALPAGQYYSVKCVGNRGWSKTGNWIVPTSATPLKLKDIWAGTVPSPGIMIPMSQFIFTGQPTISDFTRAGHTHLNPAGGGLLDAAAVSTGIFGIGRIPTGTTPSTVAFGNHLHTGVYEPSNVNIQLHISNTSNPHVVTAAQVGLGNVSNTSDAAKPISTAEAAALALKAPINNPAFTGTVSVGTTVLDPVKGIVTPALIQGAASTVTQYLAIGDSRTLGGLGTTPWMNWVTLRDSGTDTLGAPSGRINIQNLGVGGQTCATILANLPSYISHNAYWSARTVATVLCGLNDYSPPNSIAVRDVYDSLAAICRGLRAAGIQVAVMTETSRNGGMDLKKDQYNQLIRSNWPSFADALVDLGMDPFVGCDGCSANATYFAVDQVHWLQSVSQNIVAPLVSAAINGILSGAPNLPTLAANTVVNGTFAADANWTKQSGWTIAGGVAVAAAASGMFYQTALVSTGNWYAVTYTLVSRTAGEFHVNFGGMTNQQGIGPERFAPGTYTDILFADSSNNGILVFASAGLSGTIDNVTLQLLSMPSLPGIVCQTAGGFKYRGLAACQ